MVFLVVSGGVGMASATPARVGYIIDGDTFAASVNIDKDTEISVRVRIRNIDTPEIHGACDAEIDMANRARTRLAELIPVGTTVDLTNIKDDKYLGRIDAHVADTAGNDVGTRMVRERLARRYSGGRRKSWCE